MEARNVISRDLTTIGSQPENAAEKLTRNHTGGGGETQGKVAA